jgi:hypothetical protein
LAGRAKAGRRARSTALSAPPSSYGGGVSRLELGVGGLANGDLAGPGSGESDPCSLLAGFCVRVSVLRVAWRTQTLDRPGARQRTITRSATRVHSTATSSSCVQSVSLRGLGSHGLRPGARQALDGQNKGCGQAAVTHLAQSHDPSSPNTDWPSSSRPPDEVDGTVGRTKEA